MPIPVFLIFAAFIVVFILLAIYGSKASKARREALTEAATALGFSFTPEDDSATSARLQSFSPFSVGSDRRGYNTLAGSIDVAGRSYRIQMGDYRYTTESGTGKDRRETTHRLSYLACKAPLSLMVKMNVRREGIFDKIAGAIGFDDIDFESLEFSKAFHVSGSEKKIVYDLLDPRMIEWYLTSEPPTLQIVADQIVLTQSGVWKPEQFPERIEWLKQFISRWPDHLVQRLLSEPVNAPPSTL